MQIFPEFHLIRSGPSSWIGQVSCGVGEGAHTENIAYNLTTKSGGLSLAV